jgi:hypothetical protein
MLQIFWHISDAVHVMLPAAHITKQMDGMDSRYHVARPRKNFAHYLLCVRTNSIVLAFCDTDFFRPFRLIKRMIFWLITEKLSRTRITAPYMVIVKCDNLSQEILS